MAERKRVSKHVNFNPASNHARISAHRIHLARLDYRDKVPTYCYILPCDHKAHYREPIKIGDYGWCWDCDKPFRMSEQVVVITPERGKRKQESGGPFGAPLRTKAVPQYITLAAFEPDPVPERKRQSHRLTTRAKIVRITGDDISDATDDAIIRNRIADMLESTVRGPRGFTEAAKGWIAVEADVSVWLVEEVISDVYGTYVPEAGADYVAATVAVDDAEN